MARDAGRRRYTLRPAPSPPTKPNASARPRPDEEEGLGAGGPADAFRRAETEDDDGYDPFSDRPADPEPRYEEDPWR